MSNRLLKLIFDPYPVRTIAKKLMKCLKLGSYEQRVRIGAVVRPYYAYIVYNAAVLAKKLGYKRISILEFGVGNGNGLVNLEKHAEQVSKLYSIDIDIYGFDTGGGLTEPIDHRDLKYFFKQGFYKLDVPKLQARLKRAKLILGDIRETSKDFFEKYDPAPIGAISYDFDLYSSTVVALNMLNAGEEYYLPRLFCYFDDTTGSEVELYNEFTGERLAINEFNQIHKDIKLGIPYYLISQKVVEPWFHKIWICQFFKHNHFNDYINPMKELW